MPSFSISRRSSTSTSSLNSRASFFACSARYVGVQMLEGRLPSVRASSVPSAVACASASACVSGAAAGSGSVILASDGSGFFFCDLS